MKKVPQTSQSICLAEDEDEDEDVDVDADVDVDVDEAEDVDVDVDVDEDEDEDGEEEEGPPCSRCRGRFAEGTVAPTLCEDESRPRFSPVVPAPSCTPPLAKVSSCAKPSA